MQAKHILETALYAEDLEAAREFYTRVLGLEVYAWQPERHVFFRSGAGMFLVFNPNTTEKEGKPGHGCRGRGHAAWSATETELEDWKLWLEKEGVDFRVHHWPGGSRSLYFSDPAGNSLELTSPRTWGMAEK